MNSNIRDAGNFYLSWPVFQGRQTVAQTLTTGTTTPVPLDTNDIDTDNGHSIVTNTDRYVAKTQGRFQVSGGISYAFNGTNWRTVEYSLNGSEISGTGGLFQALTGAGGDTRVPGRVFTQFMNGSTDYVNLLAWQNTGGNLATSVSPVQAQPILVVRMLGTT